MAGFRFQHCRRPLVGALVPIVVIAGGCIAQAPPPEDAVLADAELASKRDRRTSTTTTTTTTAAPSTTTSVVPGVSTFAEHFTRPDGLVTNEWAFWNPLSPSRVTDPAWEMTSGSLFARNGRGWTGRIDDTAPDATSSKGTNSSVFRLTTRRSDFANARVDMKLVNLGFTSTPSTPPVAWDGVHVFLRYQAENSLYYASVNRRDGSLAIKKKVPGGPSNGGTYYTLASSGAGGFSVGAEQALAATVTTNSDGSVTLGLFAHGRLVLTATDRGTGGPVIPSGKVGLRGDNTEFTFDDLMVTPL
jgi:hypothetical protein